MARNPYEVLGISENATPEEIKSAYRKKAKECHPDLHPDDPNAQEKMNEVNAAYDILSNPEKYSAWQSRQTYSSGAPRGSYQNPYGSYQGYSSSDEFWQAMYNEFYRQQQARYQQQQQYQQQYQQSRPNRTYYYRSGFSPLRMIGRVIAVIVILRIIRLIFALLMYGTGLFFFR